MAAVADTAAMAMAEAESFMKDMGIAPLGSGPGFGRWGRDIAAA
jgi:hypothetical protein